jgi:hypothetical protein
MPDVLALKVDVGTHDGMRDGVPRLLAAFARHGLRATFFLSFGPDNSGRAVFNLLRPGFLKKMVRTGAPLVYGLRTILSGTLLPARPIATKFPALVRRIEAEGHEVGVHAWDHRRWQDHVWRMDAAEVRRHLDLAHGACRAALGHAAVGCAAPAWAVTAGSLAIQDELELAYASDLRGGPPCRLRADGKLLATPQIPTTGRCIEELLAVGVRDEQAIEDALFADLSTAEVAVLALHAEIEGGPFAALCERVLARIVAERWTVRTLAEIAAELRAGDLPVRDLAYAELPGRSGRVTTSAVAEPV